MIKFGVGQSKRTEQSGLLTSSAEGVIVKASLADDEGAPFFSIDLLIGVDDIKVFVLASEYLSKKASSLNTFYNLTIQS